MSSDNCLLSKEEVLLDSLHEFYKNKNNLNKILPIVTGTSELSLRVLDYFVTNYSKKNYMSKNNPGSYLVGANEVKYYKDENNGYKNFVIISIKIDRIECLQLSREGNQRAEFSYMSDRIVSKRLIP